jgi:hypothetical protein
MTEPTSVLSAWESFYVIVGSSGGALIGLQFVVITLIADRRRRTTIGGVSAFATPTVVHLTGALVVSAIMSAPWPSTSGVSEAVGATGLAGLAYSAVVAGRTRRQTEYKPVLEDWLWYAVLPCQLRRPSRDRLAAHASPACVVRGRRSRAGPAPHWHPQRVGYGHAHRRVRTAGRHDDRLGITCAGLARLPCRPDQQDAEGHAKAQRRSGFEEMDTSTSP